MGTAVGIIGIGTTLHGSFQQEKARKRAANKAKQAARQNIAFLTEQGGLGAADIQEAGQRGIGFSETGVESASGRLQPFASTGREAFDLSRAGILAGGQPGQLADILAREGKRTALQQFGQLGIPITNAIGQRARVAGGGLQPFFNQQLFGVGGTGIKAAGDIAGIGIRGAETQGDILRKSAAGQSSALIGQAPEVAKEFETALEARLLSDAGSRRVLNTALEQGAQVLGRVI